jgi:hypothetical protein
VHAQQVVHNEQVRDDRLEASRLELAVHHKYHYLSDRFHKKQLHTYYGNDQTSRSQITLS